MKKKYLLALSMLLPLLTVASYAISAHNFSSIGDTPNKINISDVTMWQIGNNQMLSSVISGIQLKGTRTTPLGTQELSSATASFNSLSLVLIDGDWISQQAGNTAVQAFLNQAIQQGAKLATVGGPTAKFFEALDQAKVYKLARTESGTIRNPAYDNPPIAGFQLKQATTPDGQLYSYPSIFIGGSTQDADTMQNAFTNWIGG